MKYEIIGVAGSYASGKDTLSEYLVEKHGYAHVSTSDIVRMFARERYGSIERDVLRRTGAEIRQEFHPGYLVERALKEAGRPVVVSGIRALGEVTTLREAGGVMVFVDAPIEVRYERMKSRVRDGEHTKTLEEFRESEEAEMRTNDGDGAGAFNIRKIGETADITLTNATDLESFIAVVEEKLL